MILVDIGNSNIHFGIENKGEITRQFRVPTASLTVAELKRIAKKMPKRKMLICSVVPHLTTFFKKVVKNVVVVGEDVKVPIRCAYNKREIGQDRLVNAFAAKVLFPGIPVVIDFGTAITFDFLSKRGDYLGGLIFPGIFLSYQALSRCALLPKNIKINPKKTARIPKNTHDSINRGIIDGISLLVNVWIERYSQILKNTPTPLAIVTGGEAQYVVKKLMFSYVYEPHLILKGLLLLKQKHF